MLDFLTSEFAEQFRDVPPESSVEMSADSLTGFIAKVIAQRQASTTVEKKGARHSRSDIGMLQTMHDTAVALGATCGTTTEKQVIDKGAEMKCKKCGGVLAADDVDETCAKCATKKSVDAPPAAAVAQAATEPAVPATPAEPAAAEPVAQAVLVADDHDSIVKKFSDLFSTVSKQLEELKATSETTIAELKQRIEELAEQPAPGGPVANAHAVDKTFAGAGAPAADLTDPNVARLALQVANQLGADASLTATQREALAMNVIRLQRQHGIDATIVPMPSGR